MAETRTFNQKASGLAAVVRAAIGEDIRPVEPGTEDEGAKLIDSDAEVVDQLETDQSPANNAAVPWGATQFLTQSK